MTQLNNLSITMSILMFGVIFYSTFHLYVGAKPVVYTTIISAVLFVLFDYSTDWTTTFLSSEGSKYLESIFVGGAFTVILAIMFGLLTIFMYDTHVSVGLYLTVLLPIYALVLIIFFLLLMHGFTNNTNMLNSEWLLDVLPELVIVLQGTFLLTTFGLLFFLHHFHIDNNRVLSELENRLFFVWSQINISFTHGFSDYKFGLVVWFYCVYWYYYQLAKAYSPGLSTGIFPYVNFLSQVGVGVAFLSGWNETENIKMLGQV